MANVFTVADVSDRSNLSPVIVGCSSNLAGEGRGRASSYGVPLARGGISPLKKKIRALNYKLH